MKDLIFKLIYYGSLGLLAAALIFLTVTSIIVRDTEYIVASPVKFALETLFVGLVVGASVFILGLSRTIDIKLEWILFATFAAKIMLLNVMFQLSGFYTVAFSAKK